MTMFGKMALVSASMLLLSSCATIIEGSKDNVAISTNPATRATCKLTNSQGTVESFAPATVAVQKSTSDLDITCTDSATGATGKGKLESSVEPWLFGNILLGGLIGMGVDFGTGAAYNYPAQAVVPMNATTGSYYAPMPPATLPQPYAGAPYAGAPMAYAPQQRY